MIYMIRAGTSDRIKIGWTDSDPMRRLNSLQTGSSVELSLIRAFEGDRSSEKWLHHHFRDRRVVREWFIFHPDMMTLDPEKSDRSAKEKLRLAAKKRERIVCTGCGPWATPWCVCMPGRKGMSPQKATAWFRNQRPETDAEFEARCRAAEERAALVEAGYAAERKAAASAVSSEEAA